MKTLEEILQRKERRREALWRALPRLVEQLAAMGALRVVLFGSLARGEAGLSSDLDLIAVMPDSLNSRDWTRKVYAEVDPGVACDLLVYTESDLKRMLPVSRFLRHALREGKVLYEASSEGRGPALVDPSQR